MSTRRAANWRSAAPWLIGTVIWMAIIFLFSSQPDPDDVGGQRFHVGVYKLAHLVVYTVLGVLVAGAMQPMTRRAAWWAWVIVVLYAIGDEIHQAFVPGRTPLVTDVAIDAIGGLVGICAFVFLTRIRDAGSAEQTS